MLASTHGVAVFHPNPNDYWRWTHTGLQRLFEQNGDWSEIHVAPGPGTASTLALLFGRFFHMLARRAHVRPLATPVVAVLNIAGAAIDSRVEMLREPIPGYLFANFHVTAVKR